MTYSSITIPSTYQSHLIERFGELDGTPNFLHIIHYEYLMRIYLLYSHVSTE